MVTRCTDVSGGCKIKGLAASSCGSLLTERAAVEMIRDFAPGVMWSALKCCSAAKGENNTEGKVYWPREQDAARPAVRVSLCCSASC